MRVHLIIVLFILVSFACQGQTENSSPFKPIRVLPKFPGGVDSLNNFIRNNLKCPDLFESEGRVILDFIIESDGSLSNASFFKKLCEGCDKEALRVFNLMPKWIPATEFDKPVKNNYSVSFYFNCK